jgi:hypothetical protein
MKQIRNATAWAAGFALAGFALGSPLQAQNLVNNPGFETGDFSGWTQSGNLGYSGVQCGGGGAVHSGDCAAFFGPVGSEGYLFQTIIPTTPGSLYDINFWLLHPYTGAPGSQSFTAYWDGVAFFSNVGAPPISSYTQFGTILPGRPILPYTELSFAFRDDPSWRYLDDVCVANAGTVCPLTTAAVPEPSSFALLGTGVIGLFGALRRRRNSSA